MGTTSPAHLKTRGARPSLARGLIAVSLLLIAASFIRGGDASPATQTSSEYLVVAALARPYVQMPVIMSSTGRVERVVARARSLQSWQARWSPDRTMLAWVGSSGLMVERAGGGAKRTLLATNAGCTRICVPMSFAWSPDGRRILVGGAGTQTARLLVVSVKTGHAVDLVPARAWTEYVVFGWSPNGRSIAYSRASGKWATAKCCKLDLVVAKSNGGNPRTLFRFREVVHDSPVAAWSLRGRRRRRREAPPDHQGQSGAGRGACVVTRFRPVGGRIGNTSRDAEQSGRRRSLARHRRSDRRLEPEWPGHHRAGLTARAGLGQRRRDPPSPAALSHAAAASDLRDRSALARRPWLTPGCRR
jgi:hypothetical protein